MENREHPVWQFPEPDLFFDFGPGKHNSEAWRAREAWADCKIVGVEAGYKRFGTLQRAGDFPGDLLHKAVSESAGEVTGFVEGRQNMFVNKPDNKDHKSEAVTVEAVTIDDLYKEYAPNLDKSVFLWADIEGMELLMLKGATKTLASGNVVGLTLELWPRNAKNHWSNYTGIRCTADQVVSFLKDYGFNYRCIPEIRRRCKEFTSEENDPTFEKRRWFGDWLFTPEGFDIESLYPEEQ